MRKIPWFEIDRRDLPSRVKRTRAGEMTVVKAFLPLPLGQTVIRRTQVGQGNESLTYTDVICLPGTKVEKL